MSAVELVIDLDQSQLDQLELPSQAKILAALQFLRAEAIANTLRGVDATGRAFVPYSRHGHYTKVIGRSAASPKARRSAILAYQRRLSKRAGGAVAGRVTGTGVEYQSYADYKSAKGQNTVNLTETGHMLQALVVRGGSATATTVEGSLQITGEPAGRALGHQRGNPSRGLPKRQFIPESADAFVRALRRVQA
jgi:hypothetical protein